MTRKSKIDRVGVDDSDPNYVTSITIDAALSEPADIPAHEQVTAVDANTRAFRAITADAERGCGWGGVNGDGASSRMMYCGDPMLLYLSSADEEGRRHKTPLVDITDNNPTAPNSDWSGTQTPIARQSDAWLTPRSDRHSHVRT